MGEKGVRLGKVHEPGLELGTPKVHRRYMLAVGTLPPGYPRQQYYCIFDQINAAMVSITEPKLKKSSV